MSRNHIDDTKNIVNNLKSQFPDDYFKRAYSILIQLRALREELLQKHQLDASQEQELSNLMYDIEIFVEAFKVFLKNPIVTEELMFLLRAKQ
jgi:hypothetical protein